MSWPLLIEIPSVLLIIYIIFLVKKQSKIFPTVSYTHIVISGFFVLCAWIRNRERRPQFFEDMFREFMAYKAGTRLHQDIRVFQEELGNWPKVFRQTNDHPANYTVVAAIHTPENRRAAHTGAILITVIGGFLLVAIAAGSNSKGNGQIFMVGLAVIGSFGLFHGGKALLEQSLTTPLTIVFSEGEITWEGLRRYWWGGRIKEVVRSTDRRQFKAGEHRKAAAERRENEERRIRGQKLKRPMYQQASELLMVTGPVLNIWRPVAELADDEHFEKAGRLSAAIHLADSAAQGMVEGTAAQLLGGLQQNNEGLFGGSEPRNFR